MALRRRAAMHDPCEQPVRWWILPRRRAVPVSAPPSPPPPQPRPTVDRQFYVDTGGRWHALVLRMQSLLDDAMREHHEPAVRQVLYQLDMLVCQSRRTAENMLWLAGCRLRDEYQQVTSLTDVILAASCQIAGWQKITVGSVADIAVDEWASVNLIATVSELVDNAARHTPRSGHVTVAAHLLYDGGVLLRVEDGGAGLTPAELSQYNYYLQNSGPTEWHGEPTHHGLQIVRRATQAHGIRVALASLNPRGTVASIYIPTGLLRELPPNVDADTQGRDRSTAIGRAHPINGFATAPTTTPRHAQTAATSGTATGLHRQAPPEALPVRPPPQLRERRSIEPTPAAGTTARGLDHVGDQFAALRQAIDGDPDTPRRAAP